MKSLFIVVIFISFAAQASPFMSTKERVRMNLWSQGLEEKPVQKKIHHKKLPEEIERPLRKI